MTALVILLAIVFVPAFGVLLAQLLACSKRLDRALAVLLPEADAEQRARDRAGAYRRNFGDSPANQRHPAPWFGSDGAA